MPLDQKVDFIAGRLVVNHFIGPHKINEQIQQAQIFQIMGNFRVGLAGADEELLASQFQLGQGLHDPWKKTDLVVLQQGIFRHTFRKHGLGQVASVSLLGPAGN